jgi:hypothetical protein
MFKKEKHFYRSFEGSYAIGSKYAPLQTDGYDILCPECGGYGYIMDKKVMIVCTFCYQGYIPLDDERVVGINFT